MIIEEIKLRNYRNLGDQRIKVNPSLNLVFGPNGSGKTNLCESIHFASSGDNLKGSRQKELINWDSEFTLIKLLTGREDRIVVYLKKGEGKQVKVNSKNRRQSDLRELVPTHTFVPEDLYISKGPPRRRRSAINSQISLLDHEYGKLLSDYRSELQKKNTLLKKEDLNFEFLEVLNERMTDLGARITVRRADYLGNLNELLPELYGKFVDGTRKLSLDYEEDLPEEVTEESVKDRLRKKIEENRKKEMERETAVVGPHRDKFGYKLEGRDLRKYGSQGELRTAVIATYLGYLQLYHRSFDDWPVLILDDILSELDRSRGEAFLQSMPEGPQIFMTTATRNQAFRKLDGDFSVLRIEAGIIEPQ